MNSPGDPPVWRDMNQQALDEAYAQANHAPDMVRVLARLRTNSASTRARLGDPRCVSYGPGPLETIDIFAAAHSPAPIHMFIHGGAWHSETADAYAFAAGCFVGANVHYLVPEFCWVQDADQGLTTLVEQLRNAVKWVYEEASSFGGDPQRIFLSGHSSGAHLAAVLLTTDWETDFDLPQEILKGGLLCSGVYDLEPVRRSSRNDYLALTDEVVHELSPLRHLDRLASPLVVAHGSEESPEFIRQARDFADAVVTASKPVQLLVGVGCNHFQVIETLADKHGLLGRAALDQIDR